MFSNQIHIIHNSNCNFTNIYKSATLGILIIVGSFYGPSWMVYCLNPDCQKPVNPDLDQQCQCCGRSPNLLRHRYKILKPIGQGGFGKTYLAEDIDNFHELCVVKQLICPTQDQQIEKKLQLFLREAQQLQKLKQNPQVPSLLAYFEDNQHPYLVQEFVDGQNLQEELDQNGIFNEDKIRLVLLDLLPILQDIHEQNIVHRDLKPVNIMRRFADQHLVLIDFGIAKQDSFSKMMQSGTILGTEGFAPLEQFIDGKVCPASDLFSLGVCCFNLLTGIYPDHLKHLQGYAWVNEWQKHLPQPISQDLAAIIDKLLRIKICDRFTSADEVLAALAPGSLKYGNNDLTLPTTNWPTAISTHISSHYRQSSVSLPSTALEPFSYEGLEVDPQGKFMTRTQYLGQRFLEDLGNDFIEMVAIPAGQFWMGSADHDPQRYGDEGPQHRVSIAPFYLGRVLITQAQWQQIMGSNPSSFQDPKRPVEQVSWIDVVEFCQRLSHRTGRPYRLPSEAEWEYACRAGTTTPFQFGASITSDLANFDCNQAHDSGPQGQYRKQTTEVGSFPANAFGLYDMAGNLWEWCQDTWHSSYHNAPNNGSAWEEDDSSYRVLRGGAWIYSARYCRSAARYYVSQDCSNFYIGFRIALSSLAPEGVA